MPSTRSAPTTIAADGDGAPAERVVRVSPELEAELRQAVATIEYGNYLELTLEQLQEWAETGSLRELDERLELPD